MDRKHKVKITVAGTEYIVLTHESESYTRGLAEQVDESIQDMCINGRISITAAAILTAVNLCDKLKKYENDADALGEQIEKYLETANEQMNRYNELKAENERLKKIFQSTGKGLVKQLMVSMNRHLFRNPSRRSKRKFLFLILRKWQMRNRISSGI